MSRLEQHKESLNTLATDELGKRFNELENANPEIMEAIEKHGDLARVFGHFAIAREYDEDSISTFINFFSDFTINYEEQVIDQGLDREIFLAEERRRLEELFEVAREETSDNT